MEHLLVSLEKCVNISSSMHDFSEDHSMGMTMALSTEDIINDNSQQILEEENDVTMQDVV